MPVPDCSPPHLNLNRAIACFAPLRLRRLTDRRCFDRLSRKLNYRQSIRESLNEAGTFVFMRNYLALLLVATSLCVLVKHKPAEPGAIDCTVTVRLREGPVNSFRPDEAL